MVASGNRFCTFFVLLTTQLFHPNFGVFPLHQIEDVAVSQSGDLKLFGREIIFEIFQPVWKTYLNVTDREDRQTTCNLITAASSSGWIRSSFISARQHICYSALYAIARPYVRPSVCLSLRLSVRHTGGSVKDG